MKHFLVLLLLLGSISLYSQVDNYSLSLTGNGYVNAGQIHEINQADTYTFQVWIHPATWSPGAAVFSRGRGGEELSLRLGASSGKLIFTAGTQSVQLTAAAAALNQWAHISIIHEQGNLSVRVNSVGIHTSTTSMTIPASNDPFLIGEHFNGRIDELRVWTSALPTDFLLWRNTLNKYHPHWNQLVLYYKFDQNLCENVVDYTFNHHGVFSSSGAQRTQVTDNKAFKYRKQMAYTDFSRFADRGVDREKYLLANDIIMLGVESDATGKITLPFPVNQGELTNTSYLPDFQGRQGVVAFNGAGAAMSVGPNALIPDTKYSFHTWIYLDEWTEGAFIFKKESSATQGFSIRLGNPETKELIVRLNGLEFKRPITPAMLANPVGNWWHLGIVAFSLELGISKTFMFAVNGKGYFPNSTGTPATQPTTLLPQGVAGTTAVVGQNLKAKLDETVIWHIDLTEDQLKNYMNELPMPGFGKIITAQSVLYKMNSYWNYDSISNPGYDSYSYKHFMNIVRSAYKGYRGYTLRMSVKGHDNWQGTIADAAKRKLMAQGIVAAASDFDGIDLDFEWCYDGTCFNNYGLLIEEVGKLMPGEKIFTVSPHYVSYAIPAKYFQYVDYFNFQIYGPQPYIFKWNTFTNGYSMFVNHGYPKDKILLSYATTTSRATTDQAGSNVISSSQPIGVRNGLLEPPYTPDMDVVLDANGQYRHITGVNQTYNRSEFIHTNDLAGIFYWDMGNDVSTAHPYSLPKWSNFAVASNVDSIITQVTVHPTSLQRPAYFATRINVYPNPASEFIQYSLPGDAAVSSISLYNAAGQLIDSVANPTTSIPVARHASGLYTLRIYASDGTIYSGKFIKN
jgi:hypothetical protein